MSTPINKDTKIFCSFSKKAGNKGCEFFNKVFSEYNINAIYKSFSVDNIHEAIKSAKTLKFSGCAIAMPYKKVVYEFIADYVEDCAIKSQSVNTLLINSDGITTGYSTDYFGANKILSSYRKDYGKIFILGSGGLSGAVQAASIDLGFDINVITRTNWNQIDELKNSLVYNCTPLNLALDKSNKYIDCLIGTEGGDLLNKLQAHKQFELYTGIIINEI